MIEVWKRNLSYFADNVESCLPKSHLDKVKPKNISFQEFKKYIVIFSLFKLKYSQKNVTNLFIKLIWFCRIVYRKSLIYLNSVLFASLVL